MIAAPRIALIDDNRDWLEALAEYFRAHGYLVQTANDPSRGLGLLTGDRFGLALVDFHMPGMDGMQLVRQLRHRHLDLPVILLGSDDEPSLAARAVAAGARAFLPKTVSAALLLNTVRQVLDSQRPMPARAPRLQPWERLLPRARRPARG